MNELPYADDDYPRNLPTVWGCLCTIVFVVCIWSVVFWVIWNYA
jgi:hypothetical protein